jgi:8-oxo-dGTP diphosphatase
MNAERAKLAAPAVDNIQRPLTTVDVVIFTVFEDALKVLLVKRGNAADEPYPGQWALPGGFIDVELDDDLERCALRKLKEKTGLNGAYLEQLGGWGSRTRDPRGWSATHAYFSLVANNSINVPMPNDANRSIAWMAVNKNGVKELGSQNLAFDHNKILSVALGRLRSKVEYTSLPAFLLDKEFTLSELQKTYEIVLDRKLEKSAFRTRILATNLVVEVPRARGGSNRPAQLYRLRAPTNPVFFQRTFKPV